MQQQPLIMLSIIKKYILKMFWNKPNSREKWHGVTAYGGNFFNRITELPNRDFCSEAVFSHEKCHADFARDYHRHMKMKESSIEW